MFVRLLVLFTAIPLVELALLIEVGKRLGLVNTIAIVVLTGIAGAALARSQGFRVIERIRSEMARGQMPADGLIDGILVLAGALLLLTPGLLTDVLGFLVLIPASRNKLKEVMKRFIMKRLRTNEFVAHYKVER